jgi:cytochrome c oxidase subunit II
MFKHKFLAGSLVFVLALAACSSSTAINSPSAGTTAVSTPSAQPSGSPTQVGSATSVGPTFTPSPPIAASPTAWTMPYGGPYEGQQFSSNGQRIYFTAMSDSGQPITYRNGPTIGMMAQLACVNCHGPDGHGGRISMMMYTFDAPNITWPALTNPDPTDHLPFTESTVKRAITQGIDEADKPLDRPMPQWSMTDSDLNDLINFLKTLQ